MKDLRNELKNRLKVFNSLAELSFPSGLSQKDRLMLMADSFLERMIHKTELQDYFQYEFYNLRGRERRKYMTFSRLRHTINVCNNPSKRNLFDDKAEFNRTFSSYLSRDWLDVTQASFEDFEAFVQLHPSFFAKARSGMFGKNAGKCSSADCDTREKLQNLFLKLKREGCIAEELISQHPLLEKFNMSSVNTVRVVTLLCADGTPRIMAGVLRLGRKGKTADNFHHYGIASTIDVDSGIVNSLGIDREFHRYAIHPDSGQKIIGFEIPSWKSVTDLVKKAALVVPDVRYVGWDVAIDSEGKVQLIEGNFGADPDVTQMPCRQGKWSLYEQEVEKIASLKRSSSIKNNHPGKH